MLAREKGQWEWHGEQESFSLMPDSSSMLFFRESMWLIKKSGTGLLACRFCSTFPFQIHMEQW